MTTNMAVKMRSYMECAYIDIRGVVRDVGPGFLQGGKEPGTLVEQAIVEVYVQCREWLLSKRNSS